MNPLARLAGFALLILVFTAHEGFGQETNARTTARKWYAWVKEIVTHDEAKQRAAIPEAYALLKQIEEASDLARAEDNHAALEKDGETKAKAHALLAKEQRDLADDEEFLRTAPILETAWKDKDPLLVTRSLHGHVTVQSKGEIRPYDRMMTLHDGDVVATGSDGFVVLLIGRHSVALGSNSSFVVRHMKLGPIERMIIFLSGGRIHVEGISFKQGSDRRENIPDHYDEDGDPIYNIAHVLVAVKGTEFDLKVDAENDGRLIPFSGSVQMSTVGDAPKSSKDSAPWLLDAFQRVYQAPVGPALARVSLVSGEASVMDSGHRSRGVVPDDEISADQQVETGDGAYVLLDLAEGQRAVLAPSSRLSAGVNARSGAPYYAVKEGRARFWGTGRAIATRILTPNSVAEPRATRYEIDLSSGGAAGFTIGGGTLTITAVESKLDTQKIDRWWNE